MKILVSYFSVSGVTEKVAEKIKGLLIPRQQEEKPKDSTGWGAFFSGKGEKK